MADEIASLLHAASFPRDRRYLETDFQILEKFLIGSYAPEKPIISETDSIACIGSCFAAEMATSLSAQGRNVVPIFLSERWSTAFAAAHFVKLALDGTPIPQGFIPRGVKVDQIQDLQGALKPAQAIILTLGLSLCWHDLLTDEMVLDVPGGASGHGLTRALGRYIMKQSTVEQNVREILKVIEVIRANKSNTPIILTVSPVPLLVSFTEHPVVPSNNISKAILRAAVHSVMEKAQEGVYYWPSYDIVEWIAKYKGSVFGQDGEDLRHIAQAAVRDIMAMFSRYYFRRDFA